MTDLFAEVTNRIVAKEVKGGATGKVLKASYTKPFIAHASIGPSCAIASMRDGKLEVWTHSQGIFNLRHELAVVLGLSIDSIVVNHAEGAGCYGHNGADDAALDAALLARAANGRPVKLQWSREDEFIGATTRHQMTTKIKVGARKDGTLTAIDWQVISNTGAYGNHGGETLAAAMASPMAAYRCDNKRGVGRAVYTNMVPGGGFRGRLRSASILVVASLDAHVREGRIPDRFECRHRTTPK